MGKKWTKDDDEAYRLALEQFDKRFDKAKSPLEQIMLMGELTERMRTDIWMRDYFERRKRIIERIV